MHGSHTGRQKLMTRRVASRPWTISLSTSVKSSSSLRILAARCSDTTVSFKGRSYDCTPCDMNLASATGSSTEVDMGSGARSAYTAEVGITCSMFIPGIRALPSLQWTTVVAALAITLSEVGAQLRLVEDGWIPQLLLAMGEVALAAIFAPTFRVERA
eukprot:CAMPEP_0115405614 /NCGR_PEP_ID=MMETSP0271-20121206/18018_1 /TAXON_ID=71861 /ORGANISM="Scrippsiella trochoidea, Strain CCMP3099" /LENGTH=157 /DNA_ID=CAMNT_0002829613 /DNA_START=190 /DNA_END=659 /DNA_ORIENTATION=+